MLTISLYLYCLKLPTQSMSLTEPNKHQKVIHFLNEKENNYHVLKSNS